MHIALIISSLNAGGAERVLSELSNAWISKGYNITIITLAHTDKSVAYPLHSDIKLIHLNQGTLDHSSTILRFRNILKRILKVRKILKLLKPNLIISFMDINNMTTLLASRKLGIPVIVSERTNPSYYHLSPLYNLVRKLTYPWAERVVTQTDSANAFFFKLSNKMKAVIPNAVKVRKYIKTVSEVSRPINKIISVGRLCPHKGFKALITAFSTVAKSYPNLTLTIYGEGQDRLNLETYIHGLNLSNRAFLPGNTSNIDQVLYEADLFVFPSHYEGFPNALCEAMATGLPVIASNCSGNVDIVRDKVDGRLFKVEDVPHLTSLMVELIEDVAQRKKLSKGALELPNRFNEVTVLRLWDDLINQVTRSM